MSFRRACSLGLIAWVACAVGSLRAAQPTPRDVESAARDYRIEIYGLFRADRPAFDARRKAGDEVLRAWKARGARSEDLPAGVKWFDDASAAALAGKPLPALPDWDQAPAPAIKPLPEIEPIQAGTQLSSNPVKAAAQLRRRADTRWYGSSITLALLGPATTPGAADVVAILAPLDGIHPHGALDPTAGCPPDFAIARNQFVTAPSLDAPFVPGDVAPPNAVTVRKPAIPAEERAQVNGAELTARIRGYQRAHLTLRHDLLAAEELTVERAETLAAVLHDLTAGRTSLRLYRAIAPVDLREQFEALPETDELRKTLIERIRTTATAVDADPLLSFAERRSRGQAYAALLERLEK